MCDKKDIRCENCGYTLREDEDQTFYDGKFYCSSCNPTIKSKLPNAIKVREKYHCPVCNTYGKPLLECVQIGIMFRNQDVIYDNMKIYTCPNCHILFYEEV